MNFTLTQIMNKKSIEVVTPSGMLWSDMMKARKKAEREAEKESHQRVSSQKLKKKSF